MQNNFSLASSFPECPIRRVPILSFVEYFTVLFLCLDMFRNRKTYPGVTIAYAVQICSLEQWAIPHSLGVQQAIPSRFVHVHCMKCA